MTTNNIEKETKRGFSDPVEEITNIPRAVVAMAKDFPNGHLIPFHRHARSQLLYASSGVMKVTTTNGIWVVPPLRAVWIPALMEHQISCSGNLSMRTLYIKPERQEPVVEQIIKLAPKRVIFNPDTENQKAKKQLEDAGINVVEACTLVMLKTNQY